MVIRKSFQDHFKVISKSFSKDFYVISRSCMCDLNIILSLFQYHFKAIWRWISSQCHFKNISKLFERYFNIISSLFGGLSKIISFWIQYYFQGEFKVISMLFQSRSFYVYIKVISRLFKGWLYVISSSFKGCLKLVWSLFGDNLGILSSSKLLSSSMPAYYHFKISSNPKMFRVWFLPFREEFKPNPRLFRVLNAEWGLKQTRNPFWFQTGGLNQLRNAFGFQGEFKLNLKWFGVLFKPPRLKPERVSGLFWSPCLELERVRGFV